MIGKRIGLLVVQQRLKGSKLVCLCDCGRTRTIHTGHFNAGYFKSCGCHVVRHGHSSKHKSREYISYWNMLARCHNQKNKRYKDYGAKGIVVCERWRKSFVNFIKDMGPCPEGFLIDRIDNEKSYYPKNCRWVSRSENQNNRFMSKCWVIFGIKYNSMKEAQEAHNVSSSTIYAWCKGRVAEGHYYPPKNDCMAIPKYEPRPDAHATQTA